MRKSLFMIVLSMAMGSPAAAQTITSPTTVKTIRPWSEYATVQLRDGWDMGQRTDIGFFTWGVDQPGSNMTGKRMTTDGFGQTVFRGTPANGDPSFFLLDPLFTSGASLGKVGSNFQIVTNQYTHLLVKMRIQNEIKPPNFGAAGGVPLMQVFWSRDSIFSIHSDPNSGRTNGGLATTVDVNNNQVGIPYTSHRSPAGGNCQGNTHACGSMEGGHYVVHTIPLGDMSALAALGTGIAKWKNLSDPTAASDANWGASGITADSLRFDPATMSGTQTGLIEVDWARLVAPNTEPAETLEWSGGGEYDIVMSSETDCGAASGNYAVFAYSKASGFQFNPQAWPNGTHYVGLRDKLISNDPSNTPSSRQVRACSAAAGGRYVVLDYPTLTFNSPNPLGSSDDFATVVLNNPWDFNALTDIDANLNITSGSITTIPAERPDQMDLGNVRVFKGLSATASPETPTVGDPYSFLIRSDRRGLHHRIDTNRYRLLTVDVGVDRARDLNAGSHLRIIWHIAGETWDTVTNPSVVADAENESSDLVLRHMKLGSDNVDTFSTKYTLDRVQADMADRFRVPIETDTGPAVSPSRTGWKNTPIKCANTGCFTARTQPFDRFGLDNFRLDYHEFPEPTEFYVKELRLATHERTTGSFPITWSFTMPSTPSSGTYADPSEWRVRLYAVRIKPESSEGAGDSSPMTPNTRVCSVGSPDSFAITTSGSEPSLASGAFTWTQPTSGLVNGALYFVCAGLILPGDSQPSVFNLSQWPVIYDPGGSATLAPRLFLDRSAIRMSAKHTGASSPPNLASKTPAQTINVSQVGGSSAVGWAVDVCQNYDPSNPPTCTNSLAYIQLSRTTGSGTGSFTVQLKDSTVLPQSTGSSTLGVILRVRETSSGATSNSPQYVQLYIDIYGPSQPTAAPFGQVDTPAQNTTGVQGAVGVTGWVVDDVGITGVKIYRNCLSASEPGNCQTNAIPGSPSTPVVFVGDAAFVPGARPDVEAAFSTYPQAHQAGWGYQMLSNMLPRTTGSFAGFGGQGPLTLYAVATDVDGHSTALGRTPSDTTPTSITMNNDNIAKPFGAIDTPGQGGSTSGTFPNFGWVLTPDSNTVADVTDILIPTNGSTMNVFIDGVAVSPVTYNQCRGNVGNPVPAGQYCNDDVANIFGNPTPQPAFQTRTSNPTKFRNLDAGRAVIGSYDVNTAGYANGLHSIAWGVTDSAGRAEGIGSRNFLVVNGVSDAFEVEAPLFMNPLGEDLGGRAADLSVLSRLTTGVGFRTGWDLAAPVQPSRSVAGIERLTASEFERVEIRLPRTLSEFQWDGYHVQNGRLMPLPAGSFLDARSGRFSWQTVAGYIGDYDLLFVRKNATGARETMPVRVSFTPRFQAAPSGGRPAIGAPEGLVDQKR